MRLLFDECVDERLRPLFPDHDWQTAASPNSFGCNSPETFRQPTDSEPFVGQPILARGSLWGRLQPGLRNPRGFCRQRRSRRSVRRFLEGRFEDVNLYET